VFYDLSDLNSSDRPKERAQNQSRIIIAVLLLVIVILGSIAVYYSPLLEGFRTKNLDPAQIYDQSRQSIVTITGVYMDNVDFPAPTLVSILGTGFVITYNNSYYIVTNFHVVDGLRNSTVTFSNGDAYRARVVGSDGYSDLAIVSVNATPSEYHSLRIGSSSALKVGETVVAIGNPFGLSNTVTVGVVSQLGRSLDTGTSGNFTIADTVQFSAPINPGNSGGPLIDSLGMVVGITTASVSNSQGVGFGIPSDTISRELPLLVKNGKYDRHPYLGVNLVSMNLELAQAMGVNVTWGVLVVSTTPGGPAANSGLRGGIRTVTIDQQKIRIGGDIITSIDGNRVINFDELTAYVEEHAIPGQKILVGVIRHGDLVFLSLEVGTRPPLI
jgi:S1-C subfamily serine protease